MGSRYKVIEDRFLECKLLYADEEMEKMGIEQDLWVEGVVDLSYVIAVSEMRGGFTDAIFHGGSNIVVKVSYEEFKRILIAIKTK